jgi:DNA-binding transcriptional LysR family regulator
MTQFLDIQAFLTTARVGSFSAAGRELGLAASVVTKRVDRLEADIGAVLFTRSTRRLTLTREGERLRPRFQVLLADLDEAVRGVRAGDGVTGELRIKCPTTVGALHVGASLVRFQAEHPAVVTDLALVDRPVNPLEEGFDVALGALPVSFAGVIDVPLCPYERVLAAAPGYLADRPELRTPSDLMRHDCLVFPPVGLGWSFESERGAVMVEVHARLTVNDSRVLCEAALRGLGVAILPAFIAREALAESTLMALMPEFPVTPLWFKAMVPRNRVHKPEIAALIDHLKAEFGPLPPWDREPATEPRPRAARRGAGVLA